MPRPAPALDTVAQREQRPSVIWITGFSASGKTTVGRHLDARLRENDVRSVLLDGDDLRSIFAHRWGYTREDRVDLARVYFRLCNHLATQGVTVVIAAVAMYEDVRRWVRENVAGAVEVYLDVPEAERRERDRTTKQIYDELGAQAELYDEPQDPDLRIANYGGVTAEDAAEQILEFVGSVTLSTSVDHGRSRHWDDFYSQAGPPEDPSTFARLVAARLDDASSILEVGCGNGRDASYFAERSSAKVTAVDVSDQAIASCRARYELPNLSFISGDIGSVPDEEGGSFDAVYSRFCLHAMTPVEEDQFIEGTTRLLREGGRLFIECRSIQDPLARKGEVISKTERIFGHYRRFIIADELTQKLNDAGFEIVDFVEEAGLAKLGDDDPVVIRLEALR
jgi:adenylylsulfate kinase-like enzyme/SAM-dependent methyltransferase